jgi:hypothetical protein
VAVGIRHGEALGTAHHAQGTQTGPKRRTTQSRRALARPRPRVRHEARHSDRAHGGLARVEGHPQAGGSTKRTGPRHPAHRRNDADRAGGSTSVSFRRSSGTPA